MSTPQLTVVPNSGETKAAFLARCMLPLAPGDAVDTAAREDACVRVWTAAQESARRNFRVNLVTPQGRYDTLNGRKYFVVPVVPLVEGVYHCSNCENPEFYPFEEFAKVATAWNGRPVTLNHPVWEGTPSGANDSREVIEAFTIGMLLNVRAESEAKRIAGEAWLDIAYCGRTEEGRKMLARAVAGETIEISTGYFMEIEPVAGVYDNVPFIGIQRNYRPDHLAFLTEGAVGACSVEDGCGALRINANLAPTEVRNATDKGGTMGDPIKAARACACEKPNRAEVALARIKLADNAISDEDLRTALQIALDRWDAEQHPTQAEGEMYMGSAWVYCVFPKEVVYYAEGKLYSQSYTATTKGAVTLGNDPAEVRPLTQFVPASQREEIPQPTKEKEKPVMNKALVDALIANTGTRFEESDRAFLEGLSDDQLKKFEPVAPPAPAANTEPTAQPPAAVTPPAAAPAPVVVPVAPTPATVAPVSVDPANPKPEDDDDDDKPRTVEEYITAAPDEMREVLEEGLRMQRAKRQGLVTKIMANKRNRFTADHLKTKGLGELEMLAELATTPDFSSNRKVPTAEERANADPNAIPPPPKLVPVPKAS